MRFLWQHCQNRLVIAGTIALIIGSCTFPPPDPWTLPMRTIQVPVHGEVGQVILPYLLERPDSLKITCPPQIQATVDLEGDTLIIRSLDTNPGNYLTTLTAGGRTATLAVRVIPRFAVNFQLQAEPGATHEVEVVGGFTGWTENPLSLLDLDRDGLYEATAYLTPQRHEYSLVVDGKWLPDPTNPDSIPNPRMGTTSIMDLRDSTAQAVGFFVRSGHAGRNFQFQYHRPPGAEPVDPESIVLLVDNLKLSRQQWTWNEINGELQITFHYKTRGFVRILAEDQRGNVCRETQFLLDNGKTISAATPQDTWYTKTIYFPLTDRFFDGDPYNNWSLRDPAVPPIANYFGGDLEGMRYKIEEGYFDSLGIGALWISPLNQGPDSAYTSEVSGRYKQTGYHGYWPVHPSRVESRIGGRTAALELVSAAHDRGMKVILDYVAHHTHRRHPYFNEHRNWYQGEFPERLDETHGRNERRRSPWAETYLPALDYAHSPEAVEAMTESAVWWIRTFDLDGLHHIAADQVSNRFWTSLTQKLREYFPDKTLYQLGEANVLDTHSSPVVNSIQLDGQTNLDLYYATRESFALGSGTMTDVAWNIEHNLRVYEPLNLMGTLASSYNLARFISLADHKVSFTEDPNEAAWSHPPTPARGEAHERLRLYYAFILTLPGVPTLYYGDEIGLAGAGDPDNRRPMKWSGWSDDEQTTFRNISQLIHMRRRHPALAVGDLVIVTATEDILAYRRVGFNEEFLVVLNKGDSDQAYTVRGSNFVWQPRFGAKEQIHTGTTVKLGPRSAAIFQATTDGNN